MQDLKFDTDLEALTALKKDRTIALEFLYTRYWKDLYYTALRFVHNQEDAEDLVHDIFVQLWEQRHRIEIDHAIGAYLRTALKNKAIRRLNRAELHEQAIRYMLDRFTQLEESVLQVLIANDLEKTLSETIAQFPANMQKILLMRNEDYSVKEISEALGLAEQTVRNNLNDAIHRLKNRLSKDHPEIQVGVILIALFPLLR